MLPDQRSRTLHIGALAPPELSELLTTRLRAQLARKDADIVHRATGGNPFFALEIGRAMEQRQTRLGVSAELPIPATLQELVGGRLAVLPPEAQQATRVAAALSRPTAALIAAVLGEEATAALDVATAAGILELDGERVRFTHSILASVTYAQIPPAQRRLLHARLAEVVDDIEEQGRHRALAADRPDATVAEALDEAARRAWARGAPDASADLWEQARRLTPAHDAAEGRRRGIEAAERYFDAGDVDRAKVLLEGVVDDAPAGRERARALTRLAWVRAHRDGFYAGEEIFRAALAEHCDDVRMRIEIEAGLAWCVHSTTSIPAAEVHARTAVQLAETLGDPDVLAGALSHLAFIESLKGEGLSLSAAARATRLHRRPGWSQILGRPDWIHALLIEWSGALPAARTALTGLLGAAIDRGDEHVLPHILFHLARVELHSGDWAAATVHARECRETTELSEQAGEIAYSSVIEALVDAHYGRVDETRAKIDQGLERADEFGAQPAAFELLATRGFLELSLGNPDAALQALDRVAAAAEAAGFREPAPFRFCGDHIEAAIAVGRRDQAEQLLDELDARAEILERAWVRAVASRGRALLAAVNGRPDLAYERLDHALELHQAVGEPFEQARTLLVLGSVQRRDRQKSAARESLQSAYDTFSRLGADLWVAKTEAELARIGGRAAGSELTPTERRVAELIASGLSYRETADALFISPKTVQWNLSKIYRKLGVRSGTELAAHFASRRGEAG
jgi:DNA-binding CsgD family transcriptional regulator